MDKKGEFSFLISFIIILIGLALIFSVIGIYGFVVIKSVDRTICNLSVVFRYGAGGLFGGLWDTGKLKCKTEEVEIKPKEEVVVVMREVADQMRWCWWQMGKGKIDYLSSWDFGFEDSACVICSKINTEGGEIRFDAEDFGEFLSENSYRFGSDITYANYFSGTDNSELAFGEGEFVFDETTPLYITFMAGKNFDDWASQITKGVWVGGAAAVVGAVFLPVGVVGGAVIGITSATFTSSTHKTTFHSTLLVSSGDKLINRCDRLE